MNPEHIKILVAGRIQQATEALENGRDLLSAGRGVRTAVNRAYYAAFYDEHTMYRVQRPTLRRQLYHLCLRGLGTILLEALCNCRTSTALPSN